MTKRERDAARRRAEVAIAQRHQPEYARFRAQVESDLTPDLTAEQRRNKLNQTARRRVAYMFREEFKLLMERETFIVKCYGVDDDDDS